MTREAAIALARVQEALKVQNYSLVIYDSYRPQTAVDTFVTWSFDDTDMKMKDLYYPSIEGSKKQLFDDGYIASKSGHTRGSTVDLTIIEHGQRVNDVEISHRVLADETTVIPFLDDGTVDMGSSFDLFHAASHHDSPYITDPVHIQNRDILRQAMMKQGFKDYENEWWHYTLASEPYPSTYFDFIVEGGCETDI